MTQIRVTGAEAECAAVVAALRADLLVREVSGFYPPDTGPARPVATGGRCAAPIRIPDPGGIAAHHCCCCVWCGRGVVQHWNPHGQRFWSCAELGGIEQRIAFWSRPWWWRAWARLCGAGRPA